MKEQSEIIIVTAWNNGAHHPSGAGYGLKISSDDRERWFKKEWNFIELELEGKPDPITVNIQKKSFWSKSCGELINKEIGLWFKEKGICPWPKGFPPKLLLEPISDNRFRIKTGSCKNS